MELHVKLEQIDLSDHELGDLGFPSLEAEIRRLAAEYIKGVLENSLRLEVLNSGDEEDGPKYVTLWANLNQEWETVIAEVMVDDLFKEYLKNKEKADEHTEEN